MSNWPSYVSAFGSVVALVLSLIVFFRQRRREIEAHQYDVYIRANDKYIEYLHLCLENPNLDVFEVTHPSPDKSEESQRKTLMVFSILFATLEHAYWTYASRKLTSKFEQTEFENWKGYMEFWSERPPLQAAWKLLREDYEESFQQHMDRLIALAEAQPKSSSPALATE